MIPAREDKRDGRWHTLDPAATTTRISTWNQQAGRSTARTLRVWRGRITRFIDGRWEHDQCPDFDGHYHRTRKGAADCARRAAGRLNRAAA